MWILRHQSESLSVFKSSVFLPAVDNYRSSGGWIGHFDSADEGQKSGGVIWNSVIRPAGEVELLDLPHFVEATLSINKQNIFLMNLHKKT